ncbi:hypothetical protein Asal01_02976 [Fodinibius salicampi]|nr:IS200/IS605 family transposase [Fodinibius salicampi]
MKSYSSIWIHLIWTTKSRMPLLHKHFRISLFKYMKENACQKGLVADMINGIEDHVHCLIRLLPDQKVSDFVKQIKGNSSRWINKKQYLEVPFSWQVGYGAISVSTNNLADIRQYIINQEKHQQHWKLEEELERFEFYGKRK